MRWWNAATSPFNPAGYLHSLDAEEKGPAGDGGASFARMNLGSSVAPRPPELLPIQLVRCAVIARGRPIPRLIVPVAVIRVWVSAGVSVSVRHAPSPSIRVPSSTAATGDLHNGGVLFHTEAGNRRCSGPCIRDGHQAERRYGSHDC